jgi:protein required for attachment to host cells
MIRLKSLAKRSHSSALPMGSPFAMNGSMNMNSLIIVADAARARLFRTAPINVTDSQPSTEHGEEQVELIEVDALDAREAPLGQPESAEAHDELERRRFAQQVVERVARFAQYHFCNPVIVAAPQPVASSIVDELGREVRNTYVRTFIGDFEELPPGAVLDDLQRRGAFAAVKYASVERA